MSTVLQAGHSVNGQRDRIFYFTSVTRNVLVEATLGLFTLKPWHWTPAKVRALRLLPYQVRDCLCVCLYLSVSPSLCPSLFYVSVSLCLSLSLSLSVSVSVSLCLCLCACLCAPVSLSQDPCTAPNVTTAHAGSHVTPVSGSHARRPPGLPRMMDGGEGKGQKEKRPHSPKLLFYFYSFLGLLRRNRHTKIASRKARHGPIQGAHTAQGRPVPAQGPGHTGPTFSPSLCSSASHQSPERLGVHRGPQIPPRVTSLAGITPAPAPGRRRSGVRCTNRTSRQMSAEHEEHKG